MKKATYFLRIIFLLALMLSLSPATHTLAQGDINCENDVVVQADDWLSKLADKFYGNPLAFPAIFDATNAKAANDDSYAVIASPDSIEVGWKLCVPSTVDAENMLTVSVTQSNVSAAGVPQRGGEITWAITGDPVSLAPFGVLLGLAQEGKQLGYDSLVEYDRNLNIQPALATHWENPDDRTWIFHLRKGVKFHDGSDFSAEDVMYSLTHMRNPTDLDPSASSVDGFMPKIESFEALDEYTIKIVTPNPDATLLGWFAWSRWSVITSKDFYDNFTPSTQINGTGPFKLVEYIPNDRIVFERFENYWKPDQPYVDKITIKIIPDEAARVAALRAGEIDGTRVSNADITIPLQSDPNINIITGVTGQNRVLQVSVKGDGKPWNDIRVRQAMSMAINRQDIADKVYGGRARLTASIPEGWGPYGLSVSELEQNPYLQYNPERAKELLAEAGFADGFDVNIITVAGGEYEVLAEVIQANLADVGIRATIDARDGANYAPAYRDGTFELLVNAHGYRLDPTGKLNQYGAPDAAPQMFWYDYPNGWQNPEMEVLYDQAVGTFSIRERAPIIQELQTMGLEEATFIYLVVPERIDIVNTRVKNWYTDFVDFNQPLRTVWIEE